VILACISVIIGQVNPPPFRVPEGFIVTDSTSRNGVNHWSLSKTGMTLDVTCALSTPDQKLSGRLVKLSIEQPERVKAIKMPNAKGWIWYSDWRKRADSKKFVLSVFMETSKQSLFIDWTSPRELTVLENASLEILVRTFKWPPFVREGK